MRMKLLRMYNSVWSRRKKRHDARHNQGDRDMLRYSKIVDSFMYAVLNAPTGVARGSIFEYDNLVTNGHSLSGEAHRNIQCALDHLKTAILSMNNGVYSPYTIIRSSLESSATALWLMSPVDRQERVSRALLVLNKNLSYESDYLSRRDPEYWSVFLKQRGSDRDDIFAAVRRSYPDMKTHELSQYNIATVLDSIDLIGEVKRKVGTHGVKDWWMLCSGMAHSYLWAGELTHSSRDGGLDASGMKTQISSLDQDFFFQALQVASRLINIAVDRYRELNVENGERQVLLVSAHSIMIKTLDLSNTIANGRLASAANRDAP